jgi:glycosyltransferase involved in cell wall biosynthesis
MSTKISAYILAKNEAANIVAAVQSITFADEIIVLDTGSEDETIALAQQAGARVVEIPFPGFGPARRAACAQCQHDWIFTIDADERCTPELANEIQTLMANDPQPSVYLAPTANYMLGKRLRHGGYWPDYRNPVLFHHDALQYNTDAVHEGFTCTGPLIKLTHPRLHYPYQDLSVIMHKAQVYSSLGATDLANKGKPISFWSGYTHAWWKFFRLYIIKGGVLDGWRGYLLAVNAFYETLFRYSKCLAKQLSSAAPTDK